MKPELLSSGRNNERIYDWIFFILIGCFALLKYADLHLPYFWDELGVYARASLYLAQHQISLLPSAIPPDLSRGHPLLFHVVYGSAYKLLGDGVEVGHSISLSISILFIWVLYWNLTNHYNRLVALCVVIILLSQPIFYAQSIMVLPEMLLSFLIVLSLFNYYRQNMWAFAVTSSLAILVKESAVVLPLAVIAYGFIAQIILKQKSGYFSFRNSLLTISPLLVFAVFLGIQKMQQGWFFFPLHLGFVSIDLTHILEASHACRKFLFFHQGRYWWVKVFLLVGLVLLIKGRLKWAANLATLFSVFTLLFIVFCIINFYMDRYTLTVIPLLCILLVTSIYYISQNRWVLLFSSVILAMLSARDMDPGFFLYDTDMGYKHHLTVTQQAIDYLRENARERDVIKCNFPVNYALEKWPTGFRLNPYKEDNSNSTKTYHCLTYTETHKLLQDSNLKLIKVFKESYAEADIYQEVTPEMN